MTGRLLAVLTRDGGRGEDRGRGGGAVPDVEWLASLGGGHAGRAAGHVGRRQPPRGEGGFSPQQAGRAAGQLAVDEGMFYAEGYAGYARPGGVSWPWPWAWCLDGDTAVDPAGN